LKIGEWNGVESGCICNGNEKHDTSYCYSHAFDTNCKAVGNVDPKDIDNWKADNKEYKYCAVHVDKFTHVSSGNACPTDYKLCYNNLCVGTNDECPYNDV
jgi:hypothetical protein